ncbi:MAG: hypothetical protein QHJ73_06970 [Armatimonadota bacterium]|nr:hypothetical protein [Armatimonadota bacterium]
MWQECRARAAEYFRESEAAVADLLQRRVGPDLPGSAKAGVPREAAARAAEVVARIEEMLGGTKPEAWAVERG